jgi:Flp pilus assembly protein TadG
MKNSAELLMSRRRTNNDSGATAVEMAMILPVLMLTLFFSLYGAMYFFYSAVADHVARSVARQVSIPVGQTGSAYPDATPGTVADDAAKTAGSLLPNPTSVTTSSLPAGAAAEGDLVTVTVTYKLPVLSQLGSLVPGLTGIETITRASTERRQ